MRAALLLFAALAAPAAADPPMGPADLPSQWRERDERPEVKGVLFVPRAAAGPVKAAAESQTLKRAVNVLEGTWNLLNVFDPEGRKKAGYKFADSLLNPAAVVTGVVSDAVAIVESPLYAAARPSTRIQLCVSNLSSAMREGLTAEHFLNPGVHVGVLIDSEHETEDPRSRGFLKEARDKGGIMCQGVPLLSNETESVAIERLRCVDRVYNERSQFYDILAHNCGGFTRDILHWSGLGFPGLPNAGVGNVFQLGSERPEVKGELDKRRKLEAEVKSACDDHLARLRSTIVSLEAGLPLDKEARAHLRPLLDRRGLSDDVILQLFLSAAKGRDKLNRAIVSESGSRNCRSLADLYSRPRLGEPSLASRLRPVLKTLDDEAFAWLEGSCPDVARLRDFQDPPRR